MKLLHRSLIEASKRIIAKRTARTASPDTRRPPHTINSPFNISHPHKTSSTPHLYILARTTAEGAIRKVSLTTYNDDGTIQSPGDSTGYIACSCPNASDTSQHNQARLIPGTDEPILKQGEHFVASTIVFPNTTAEAPLQRGIDLLVKLPEGITSADKLPRDKVLDEMHNALHDFGPIDIADQIYSVRFADKALGIRSLPSAPSQSQDHSDGDITENRANLASAWKKSYTESRSQPPSPILSMASGRQRQKAFNPYHVPHEYMSLEPLPTQPPILVWTPHPNLAPSLDMALRKWDPALKLPMEKIKPSHKALICAAQPHCTKIEAVIGTEAMNTALQQITTYQMGTAEIGDIRTAILGGEKPKALRTRHIMDAPSAVHGLLQSITSGKALETDEDDDLGTDSTSDTPSESRYSGNPSNWKRRPNRRTQRKYNNHSDSSDSQSKHRTHQQTTACPICQLMFANPTAALQHVAQAHQSTPTPQTHNTPKNRDNTNNEKILKASQYNDNFVQVNLVDDDMAHFFQATAQTAKDPATNTRETRYIAPRFPNTIYDIEKLVAFENIPQKEVDVWYKAFQQVSQAKQLGSYRTYHTHNIGIENTSASLLIRGQKDTLNILKNQAPTLYPQRIAELNTHLVTRWFHNQRVYCLQNRIEWCSWFEICITDKTAGREIYDRIMARLTAHPSALDVLKTVSSFIEYTVTQLLPHPVPFYQRRQEIIDMHTSQLNSAVPSVDFTRQHLDANAEELKYLHPRYDATGNQSTQAANLLQATITDEILHEIIAQSPFFGRLHHLYLSDSQFQDIRQVPRAKILADLAKLIALDQATGQSPGVTTMKTTFKSEQHAKEPIRCKACQALNVTCSDKHCKLHQPTLTSTQAQRMKYNQQNPAVLKANCPSCLNKTNTTNSSPKRRSRRSRSNTRSPHPKDNEQKQRHQKTNGSRSNSRSRYPHEKNQTRPSPPPTRVRAILTNPERSSYDNNNGETPRMQTQQTERRPYRETYNEHPPQSETTNNPQQAQSNNSHQQDEWRYANQNYHRSPYRQRWHQRSPTPNTRHDNYRPRSKSPYHRSNSPHTYRPRSQSANRYPPRSPPPHRFPRSRSVSNDPARRQRKQTPSDHQQ